MSLPIGAVGSVATGAVAGATAPRLAGGADFSASLSNAISGAERAEKTAEDASLRFAEGDPNMAIDQVMITTEKASISLRYAVALKNRAIEAYRELMNTPI